MLNLRLIIINSVIGRVTVAHDADIGRAVLDGVSGRETVTILNVRRRLCLVKMPTLNVLLETPLVHSNASRPERECRPFGGHCHLFDSVDPDLLVLHAHQVLQISDEVIALPVPAGGKVVA